jgi:hypothetical protein
VLEDLIDISVDGFCYPFGATAPEAVAGASDHYDYACAVSAPHEVGRWALPRFFIGESDSPIRLAAKLALRPALELLQRRAS